MFNEKVRRRPSATHRIVEILRWTVVLTVAIAFVSIPSQLLAGRGVLGHGRVVSEDMTIVLATINNVAKAEQPRWDDPKEIDRGFRFDLEFEQFIRPGQMPLSVDKLEVPFSSSGYGANWEFGAKPVDGMKVMAYLKRLKTGKWELCSLPGGIVILDDFEQPIVKRVRKLCRLWDTCDPAKQLEQIVSGCQSGDDWFQGFCIRALGDLDGGRTGVKLSSVIDSSIARSIVFEHYADPDQISSSGVSNCEYIFWNDFRGRGWEHQEARYYLHASVVDKIIEDGQQIHHNVFGGLVKKICFYPEYARDNYERLLKVIDGSVEVYKFGAAIRLSMIYQPHTSDPKTRRLNEEIFEQLVQFLSHDNGSVAEGAAIGIGTIAIDYSAVGSVPDKFKKLLRGETDFEISGNVRSRLNNGWRDVQKVKPPKLEADASVLAYPWDNLIGKKVVVAGDSCYRDGQHGASANVRGQRLWIDGFSKWPDGLRGNSPVLLRGRLMKVTDLPVFRYEVGKPLGEGIPVPEGFSLEKAGSRYVLLDASWKERSD